ncbi:unnamed protein product [Blepharisma stoltei]|uniref:Uncharacterized protein n=1 Tax=Blepharisma stoltei TaxID=1481888 RepID=A0AAU9IKZ5_9CILI|nr:unnamed protein product [Blepharisma stoltei]
MTLERLRETSMERLLKRQAADIYEKNNQASLVAWKTYREEVRRKLVSTTSPKKELFFDFQPYKGETVKSADFSFLEDSENDVSAYKVKLNKYRSLISNAKVSRTHGANLKNEFDNIFRTLSPTTRNSSKAQISESKRSESSDFFPKKPSQNQTRSPICEIIPLEQLKSFERCIAKSGLQEVNREYLERLKSVAHLILDKLNRLRYSGLN